MIRINKTNKIEKLFFPDSNRAIKTERSKADDTHQWVKYTFDTLSGGYNATYPLPFDFDGHFARTGDSVKLEATLYNGDGTPVKAVEKTYRAKNVGFDAYSLNYNHHLTAETTSAYNGVTIPQDNPDNLVPNGHRNVHGNVTVDSLDEKYVQPKTTATALLVTSLAAQSEGQPGKQGLIHPQNVKFVLTLPKGPKIDGFKAGNDEDYFRSVEVLSDGSTRYTYMVRNPKFRAPAELVSNMRVFNERANWNIDFTGAPLNSDVHIPIEYYYDANDDSTGGTLIAQRDETYYFKPELFKSVGWREAEIDSSGYKVAADCGFRRGVPTYYYMNKHLYHGECDLTDTGIGYRIDFKDYNNGSGVSNPDSGGQSSQWKDLNVYLRGQNSEDLYFKSLHVQGVVSNKSDKSVKEKDTRALQKVFEDGKAKLYGIRADGSRKLLKDKVEIADKIEVEDAKREFVSLKIEFDELVTLDNASIIVVAYNGFTPAAIKKLDALAESTSVPYQIEAAGLIDGEGMSPFGGTNTVFVSPLHPQVHTFENDSQQFVFQQEDSKDLKPITVKVGPHLLDVTYGQYDVIKNVRTVTILPDGFKLVKNTNTPNGWVKDTGRGLWDWQGVKEPKVQEIQNYHGTGKTAVVIDYGDVGAAHAGAVDLKIVATKYATPGDNDIVTYMSYEDNDIVRPYKFNAKADNLGPYSSKDVLDVDDDGNREEIFEKVVARITYIPPMELVLNNRVKYDGEWGTVATGELGDSISYKLNVFNNSIVPAKSLTVLDVLPYKGDHAIAPNDKGEYPARHSSFVAGLTESVESANDDSVNSMFTFYYQTSAQGDDLKSVRDSQWVTADKISDWSEVKSVKAVLRDGQEIASKASVDILIPSKIPYDTKLHDDRSKTPDKAVNSSAFTLDGTNYSEANGVEAYFATYKVNGRFFVDKNKNGVYDRGVDKPLSHRRLTLMAANTDSTDADGGGSAFSEVKHPNGDRIDLITNSEGQYESVVYRAGTYRVQAQRNSGETFSTRSGQGIEANNVDAALIKGDRALTSVLVLSLQEREATRNVAVEYDPGSVKVVKTATVEADNPDAGRPLVGVEFEIRTADGKPVTDINDKPVSSVKTDGKGELVFKDLLLGSYVVKEVKAPVGYKTDTTAYPVTITHDNPNGTVTVGNSLDRTSVTVAKKWVDDNNRDGVRPDKVTIHLLANGEKTDQMLELNAGNKWTGSFTGLVTHRNGTPIEYTVSEDKVDKYTAEVTGDAKTGFTVTNTHTPDTMQVKVTKVWVDRDDVYQVRPDKVVIHLLANGEKTDKTLELNAGNEWTGSFDNLFVNEEGEPIEYSISEDPVTGYVTGEIEGNSADGFTVTNTVIEGSVVFMKVDENKKPVAGAVFEVVDKSGKRVAEATSDSQGMVRVDHLGFGEYTVREVSAPDGYEKTDRNKQFTISEQAQVVDMGEVVNKKIPTTPQPKRLSATGVDITMVVALVVVLTGLALVAFTIKKTH
ncbi:Cna B-type domain-containing protein [Alloscardovia omnicolens]|uniref:Cna B-type domain-containing protein n=2 Tax=Alloscardovia omnicolens TaxID=419015 RepID=UPI00254F2F90|nr:Cna B-type domain-containing protein [Alloscardovia omnicolens]MDK6444695.1 Cna B-type domain-containing protein [Alloscardovia omnicolens]